MPIPVPSQLRTERLYIRRWCTEDAPDLLPVLEANVAHLLAWIPKRVASPASLPEIEQRLAGFAVNFDAGREWRYGLFTLHEPSVLGEVGLFPRAATGRVPFEAADHVEIGYWLRADMTGQGLATEAARAMLGVAASLPRLQRAEIRCDVRNEPSAAVPRRLGFRLAGTIVEPPAAPEESACELMIWEHELPSP